MPDTLDRLTAALADRYTIQRELGRGGMATVYLAEDLKHHRPVALKVLKPELAEALGTERFLREIEIAAKLQHPHILPLFDSGEAGGLLYYVMPFVEGESLRDRLRREKQIPVEEAVRLAQQVLAALSFAHSYGVIHRDIKPENILLQHGEAVVADFGIARAVTAAGGGRITQTGVAIGTPAYMSPEQATGVEDIDARSDLYAVGCVLYELLVGEAPFGGPSAQAILARHTIDPVPPIRTVRSTVPDYVEAAVHRALAKVPADRYATGTEFAEALTGQAVPTERRIGPSSRRILLGGAAVVVMGLAGWLGFRLLGVEPAEPPLAFGQPTQVTFSGVVSQRGVALSPDGRTLAYVENSHHDSAGQRLYEARLIVLDLATRQTLTVATDEKGLSHPVWHPSGDSILVFAQARGGLRAVPRLGGASRRVESPGNRRSGYDLSPDGERIAWGGGEVIVSSDGTHATVDTIRPYPKAWLDGIAWSRVGEYLAAIVRDLSDTSLLDPPQWGVLMTATGEVTDSLAPTLGGDDRARIVQLQWSHDALYVLTRTMLRSEIHRIAVDRSGRFSSDPALVLRLDGHTTGFTVSGDGNRLFYLLWDWKSAPWVIDVGENGSVSGRRRLLTGSAYYTDFSVSASGSRVAFRKAPPGGIYIMDMTGGPEERVMSDGREPSLSPDGQRIAVSYMGEEQRGTEVVDISSGEQRQVSSRFMEGFQRWMREYAWSPDGRRLAFLAQEGITVVDIETGKEMTLSEESPVFRLQYYPDISFSPDGQRIALGRSDGDEAGVWILNLADSTFSFLSPPAPRVSTAGRVAWGGGEGSDPRVLKWSDADTIYFTGQVDSDIWAVPASDGQPQLYAAIPFNCYAEAVIPEQRRVLCTEHQGTHDVWKVEALPPSR